MCIRDSYKVSLKYGIEVIMPVDAYGKYDETIVREKLFKDSDKYLGLNVFKANDLILEELGSCLLYTSPSPRDRTRSRMPSSA